MSNNRSTGQNFYGGGPYHPPSRFGGAGRNYAPLEQTHSGTAAANELT